MRYSAEHKQQTREKVLAVAARAIRVEGPDRISVAAVMADAGLTHGGFYAHFASKDALVSAAIDHMFDNATTRFQKAMDGQNPLDGLMSYIDFYLSSAHCMARGEGCPMAALASDLPRLDPLVRERFANGMHRLQGNIAGALKAAGFRQPVTLAQSVRAEMVGALTLARLEAESKRAEAILRVSREALKQRLQALAV